MTKKGKEESKDQESIQSSNTPDPGHCMGKFQNRRKHHIQESEKVNFFPTGDHKNERNRHDSMTKTNTNNKKDPQRKHRLGTESQIGFKGHSKVLQKLVTWIASHSV